MNQLRSDLDRSVVHFNSQGEQSPTNPFSMKDLKLEPYNEKAVEAFLKLCCVVIPLPMFFVFIAKKQFKVCYDELQLLIDEKTGITVPIMLYNKTYNNYIATYN